MLGASLVLGLLAVGCGGGDEQQPTAHPGEARTLADVKRACEESFTPTSAGQARVESELRDANIDVTIDAPSFAENLERQAKEIEEEGGG